MGKWEVRFTVAAGPIFVDQREFGAETVQGSLKEWSAKKVTEIFKKGEGYMVHIETKPVKEEKRPSKIQEMLENLSRSRKAHKWMHQIPTATKPMRNFCRELKTNVPMHEDGGGSDE